MFQISNIEIIICFLPIVYIWSLPLLAKLEFARPFYLKKNELMYDKDKPSTSISSFISNPQATGAMAVLTYYPLVIMSKYQLENKNIESSFSLYLFQIFYGAFLICSISYVPSILHSLVVIIFCLSFLFHSYIVITKIQPNTITKILLIVSGFSLVALIKAEGLWYWGFECIGLSAMVLFTPIDLIINCFKKN